MEFLKAQLGNISLLKDIGIPMLAAWAGIWLATRKFRQEKLWTEKYSAWQRILAAIEAISFWAEETIAADAMLPTVGGDPNAFLRDSGVNARREIAKQVAVGSLLLPKGAVSLLSTLQYALTLEDHRDCNDASGDPLERDQESVLHANNVLTIVADYLPQILEEAKSDLGA